LHKPNETIILETESRGGLLELECYNAAYWDRNAWDHNGTNGWLCYSTHL